MHWGRELGRCGCTKGRDWVSRVPGECAGGGERGSGGSLGMLGGTVRRHRDREEWGTCCCRPPGLQDGVATVSQDIAAAKGVELEVSEYYTYLHPDPSTLPEPQ